MGDILRHNSFFNTKRYYDYNMACLELKNGEITARLCIPPRYHYQAIKKSKTLLIGVTCFISSIFFLLTIAVYASLPFLRNTHGKTLICHVFSLAMGFFSLANTDLNPLIYSYYVRKY